MLTAGDGQIIVTWTSVPAADNGGAAISGYTATSTARPPQTCAVGPTVTTCIITGLTNLVVYSVVVVATNIRGNSADSTVQTATPGTALTPTTQTLTALRLGDLFGLGLYLINPVTTEDGKTYYYLDNDDDGDFDDDRITHSTLDTLLNEGSDTEDTQTEDDGHIGDDDERSVIIGSHALVLPTEDELDGIPIRSR